MKKILSLLMAVILTLGLTPLVFGVSVGTGIGIIVDSEDFEPLIWMCDSRVVYDDAVEGGRATGGGAAMTERVENYAFEGEQIEWEVLVMDKNGINKISDVFVTIGSSQGVGNDIEVNCIEDLTVTTVDPSCNARIGEEIIAVFDAATMRGYTCTFTVETPDSMQGEYYITAEVEDLDGLSSIMDENEYWFLNPILGLSVIGDVDFGEVRPGVIAYSETILVENDAEAGSGVLLDMFISGTDFYDPASSGAMCPVTNRIKLSQDGRSAANLGAGIVSSVATRTIPCNIGMTADNADHLCYFASNGAYSTAGDIRSDLEGYAPISYGDAFTMNFYNDAEIIMENNVGGTTAYGTMQLGAMAPGATCSNPAGRGTCYHNGNVLSPGAEIAITFKLGLPEPCNGDFSEGDIYFWGEAI